MIALLELVEESFHIGRNRTSVKESLHSLYGVIVVDNAVSIISNNAETYIVDDGRPYLPLVLELVDDLLDLLVSVVVIDIIADDIPYGKSS